MHKSSWSISISYVIILKSIPNVGIRYCFNCATCYKVTTCVIWHSILYEEKFGKIIRQRELPTIFKSKYCYRRRPWRLIPSYIWLLRDNSILISRHDSEWSSSPVTHSIYWDHLRSISHLHCCRSSWLPKSNNRQVPTTHSSIIYRRYNSRRRRIGCINSKTSRSCGAP